MKIPTGNAIFVIQPWRQNGVWVFDDPARQLRTEPFVMGMNEIINHYASGIEGFTKGVNIFFSPAPFPKAQSKLTRTDEDGGCGTWYRDEATKMEGWLCPALFKYLNPAPDELHFRIEPLKKD
jgi:hypothetical protein